jgi:hypothetical protein
MVISVVMVIDRVGEGILLIRCSDVDVHMVKKRRSC